MLIKRALCFSPKKIYSNNQLANRHSADVNQDIAALECFVLLYSYFYKFIQRQAERFISHFWALDNARFLATATLLALPKAMASANNHNVVPSPCHLCFDSFKGCCCIIAGQLPRKQKQTNPENSPHTLGCFGLISHLAFLFFLLYSNFFAYASFASSFCGLLILLDEMNWKSKKLWSILKYFLNQDENQPKSPIFLSLFKKKKKNGLQCFACPIPHVEANQ